MKPTAAPTLKPRITPDTNHRMVCAGTAAVVGDDTIVDSDDVDKAADVADTGGLELRDLGTRVRPSFLRPMPA
ncbi:MAG: hypothetical protein IPK13_11935 [Deltaproteobacteria bacterium]|nr:hypothetical protein [Deltaproteobacteria bacterium]